MEIYTASSLLYPLTRDQIDQIDDVWNFLQTFRYEQAYTSLHLYRQSVIASVCNRYTCNEFCNYERIAEQLFWNLRDKTGDFFTENNNTVITGSLEDMYSELIRDNSYRSFINKLILINDVQNEYYYKRIEGSSPIFSKNSFNTVTGYLLFNRQLYENIMSDPRKIMYVKIPAYYYQYDYAFPNLNYAKPFIQSDEYRRQRILKMYYDTDAESNWFRLIKPGFV